MPVEALSNALTNYSKPVTWDKKTSSVYVGKVPIAPQTDITELMEPYSVDGNINKGADASFEILDKKYTPFNRFISGSYTYMLNSNYSKLKGQFVISYKHLGTKGSSKIEFYSVNKKGEETLIKEYNTEVGEDLVPINVNVLGVDILKIRIIDNVYPVDPEFYNVTLTGIK